MANIFAGEKSGMAGMFESLLPADVREAIKVAKEQLPAVVSAVQAAIVRIETRLNEVNVKQDLLLRKVESLRTILDSSTAPEELPSQVAEQLHNVPNGMLNATTLPLEKVQEHE